MGKSIVDRHSVRGGAARRITLVTAVVLATAAWVVAGPAAQAPAKTPPILGTIKAITGDTMTVATDAGVETKVTVSATTRLLRVPPGSKDLSQALAIPLSEFQPGDRVLVRVRCAGEPPACEAVTVIAMKKSDIAAKQTQEREAWRHGIGGLVKSVDVAQGTIMIGTLTAEGKKDVKVAVGKNTVVRRYAPGSVKFDAAKISSVSDIQPGDQLRARGAKSPDGTSFAADEVVSGSFLNIAGTISAVDASAGTISVEDLATKKTETVKVSPETQLRKLPERMAQMIAMRLRGEDGEGSKGSSQAQVAGGGAANGGVAEGQRRSGDFQQLLNRLPATPLTEFQKGEAVMIVATGGQIDGEATAITVLGGVEPLLRGGKEQATSILTPWSLSDAGGEAAAQ